MTIQVDYSRNSLLSNQAYTLLKDYYCRENEDPQDAYARAAMAFCKADYDLAQRIYDYASKGWFMFSSPILLVVSYLMFLILSMALLDILQSYVGFQ